MKWEEAKTNADVLMTALRRIQKSTGQFKVN